MSHSEPSLLGDPAEPRTAVAPATVPLAPPLEPIGSPRPALRSAPTVHVAGFWRRAAAAAIDAAIVAPVAALLVLIVGKIAGVTMATRVGMLDVDMWIDLVLATDPGLVMGLTMFVAIGLTYLLVAHIVLGRTLGMRVMKLRIIDVYGDPPSPARCVARCAGYVAGVATLFLGFLWMGFDSEKRGLQDWIAGTYVIRA